MEGVTVQDVVLFFDGGMDLLFVLLDSELEKLICWFCGLVGVDKSQNLVEGWIPL